MLGTTLLDKGFGLLELLLAAALFLVVVLGALPLFVRAILDVRAGRDRSVASDHGRSQIERSSALGLSAEPAASRLEYYSATQGEWRSAAPEGEDQVLWIRRTTVRLYPLGAIEDGRLDPAEALEPGAGTDGGELTEIEVEVGRGLRSDGRGLLAPTSVRRLAWPGGAGLRQGRE